MFAYELKHWWDRWGEPIKADNELRNINSWWEVHEKDEAALRPGIQAARQVLSLYRERDEVEKKLDDLKIETLQGLLFFFFVSLIMKAILLRMARDSELLDKKSIEEIRLELAKLRAVKVGGNWRLTEISKNRERFWRISN